MIVTIWTAKNTAEKRLIPAAGRGKPIQFIAFNFEDMTEKLKQLKLEDIERMYIDDFQKKNQPHLS